MDTTVPRRLSFLRRLLWLMLAAGLLSGCVIVPAHYHPHWAYYRYP